MASSSPILIERALCTEFKVLPWTAIDRFAANIQQLCKQIPKYNTFRPQIHKIIGFVPTILQIVMQTTVEQPVRQAGAVYLKNLINSSWSDHEAKPGEPIPFSIHEQDRAMIRGAIVDAIVHAPELIR